MSASLLGAVFLSLLPAQLPTPSGLAIHELAERDYRPAYLKLATGDLQKLNWRRHAYPWPVKLKCIGNSSGSYQRYWGSSPYFHMGLDMRADAGSEVVASAGGKILGITNYEPGIDAYWEIAIQDEEGFIWQYHHIDHDSIPASIFEAWHSGTPIAAGVKLGEVFYWDDISEGEHYHHIHVNIAGKDQVWISPFQLLSPLEDHSAPEFVEVFLTQNGQSVEGNDVSGKYSIAAHVRDLVLSEKFYLPPHSLSYELDGGPSTVVWRFDTLPGGSSNTDYVNSLFVPGLTCGDYECRRPILDLGFTKTPTQVFPTSAGKHHLKITAKDFVGNTTTTNFDWNVN